MDVYVKSTSVLKLQRKGWMEARGGPDPQYTYTSKSPTLQDGTPLKDKEVKLDTNLQY